MLRAVRSDLQGLVCGPADHHPALRTLADAVAAGDRAGVVAFFAGMHDHGERVHAGRMIAHTAGAERLLAPVAMAEHGDTTLARTLYAMRLVVMGRTPDAEHAGREHVGREHLIRAEQLLIDATVIEPDNVMAWTARIRTARALGLGRSEARRRYDHVAWHAPHLLVAQRQYLRALPAGGEEAEAFVRERVAAAPPGSPVPALLLDLHLARRRRLDPAARERYLTGIHDDLSAVERALADPAYAPGFDRYRVHHALAFLLGVCGLDGRAAAQFRLIGPHFVASPWDHLPGDAVDNFLERRARALAGG
jgi:hypothetical protein